jgi:RHS repeat-associated protein
MRVPSRDVDKERFCHATVEREVEGNQRTKQVTRELRLLKLLVLVALFIVPTSAWAQRAFWHPTTYTLFMGASPMRAQRAPDTGTLASQYGRAASTHLGEADAPQARRVGAPLYDWLGNSTQTDDDTHGFYDRSVGAITNGTASQGPYQLKSALGAVSTRDGSLTTGYDDAGNLTSMNVVRYGPCLPTGANCTQSYVYTWDEVGRLVQASRWDSASTTGAAAVQLQYAYDASDGRVLKTATDPSGNSVYDAYIFHSLELRRTTFAGGDYQRTPMTEVPYLSAHGVRLARLHYEESGSGAGYAPTGGAPPVGDAGAGDSGTGLTIFGTALGATGAAVSGATVTMTGTGSKTTTTSSTGTYSFTGLVQGGSYALAVTKSGCAFTPSPANINNLSGSFDQNFRGTGSACGGDAGAPSNGATISISGQITNASGIGVAGVTLQMTGSAQGATQTDAVGNYSFGGLATGSYSVTPTQSGCMLTPSVANLNNITKNTTQSFTASGTGCVAGGNPEPTAAGSQLHVLLELPDHLGSTSIVVDRDTSELVERGTYLAYGQSESDYRPTRWDSFREDYRFTGKEEDVEVGLEYFGKRFLVPGLGRWASADPLTVHGFGGDLNGYAYVHGSLLSAADPVGLDGPPSGSAENPIITNQQPVVDGKTVNVAAGQTFAPMPGSGVKTFGSVDEMKAGGASVFYKYNPGATNASDWGTAELFGKIAELRNSLSTGESGWVNKAEQIAHPLDSTSPTGSTEGIPGGMCSTCWGSKAAQEVDLAVAVGGLIDVAKSVAKAGAQLVEGALERIGAGALAPSSRALAAALEKAGFARGAGEVAHHIVAGSAKAAAPARAVLTRFRIGINDAANGVFLPGNLAAKKAVGAAVHSTIHTNAYYSTVNSMLRAATTREEALAALGAIRQGLREGGGL